MTQVPSPAQNSPPQVAARKSFFPLSETASGIVLLIAALAALAWANSPMREAYYSLAGIEIGPADLGLNMSIAQWASDGILTIFFFVVGLELMQELRIGALSDPKKAAMPMIAAVLGMAAPSLIYVAVQMTSEQGAMDGWAIPVATDIAFAVALLGVFGKGLPSGARVFLLTLAVVDDLLAIIVIAIFYTESLSLGYLAGAAVWVAIFAVLTRSKLARWWTLLPVALVAWACMFLSGVHATIAGVALGLSVPVIARAGEWMSRSHAYTALISPFSNAIALPVFAFFAAGVTVVGGGGLGGMMTHPVTLGVMCGLVLGKPLGIWVGTAIITKLTPLDLPEGVKLADLLGVSILAGIGFTVSLLIANLSFDPTSDVSGYARLAVILGSFVSAILGGIVLEFRTRAIAREKAAGV